MPEPQAVRELFVYWRLASEHREPAVAAATGWISALGQRHPGLQARLYLRADSTPPWLTLMETYALPPLGIGTNLESEIRDGGTSALATWVHGERHVEVFDRLA